MPQTIQVLHCRLKYYHQEISFPVLLIACKYLFNSFQPKSPEKISPLLALMLMTTLKSTFMGITIMSFAFEACSIGHDLNRCWTGHSFGYVYFIAVRTQHPPVGGVKRYWQFLCSVQLLNSTTIIRLAHSFNNQLFQLIDFRLRWYKCSRPSRRRSASIQ